METNHVAVDPRKVVRALTVTTALLVLASVTVSSAKYGLHYDSHQGFVELFELDAEMNVPSFFATLMLLGAAVLLACITKVKRAGAEPMVSRWAVLTVGLTLMAYDEAFQVHESLISPVRARLGGLQHGVLYYAWVVPGLALVVLLALFFLRFLRSLPTRVRREFLLAALLFLGGAMGIELLEGRYVDLHGDQNLTIAVMTTFEETMEMAGVIIFIGSLLGYLGRHYGELRFHIGAPLREGPVDSDGASK